MDLKWLHISDIHCSYNNYDTKRMRKSLIKYLIELEYEVDCVFITGDLAYQNKGYTKELLEMINNICKVLNVDINSVYLTPGNHDLKRGGIRESIVKLIQNSNNPIKELNELSNPSYKTLLKGFDKYKSFYEKLKDQKVSNKLHEVVKTERYNLININTCLTSGLNGEDGKLLVDLDKLLKEIGDNDIDDSKKVNIAFGHHGVGCLLPEEREKFKNLLADYDVDFYLSGHYHQAKIEFDTNNTNDIHHLTVGGHLVDGYSTPCFNISKIDFNNREVSVTYHRWFQDKEMWGVYPQVSRRAAINGSISFPLNRISKKNTEEFVEIDNDSFRDFIVNFHKFVETGESNPDNELNMNDIRSKFKNMNCSLTLQKNFDKLSEFFPIIGEVMDSGEYIDFDKKTILPEVIVAEYNKVFNKYDTGTEIFEAIIDSIFERYKNKVEYSNTRLKTYIRILVFWSIHECDIFNEKK
ncbi:MAG: metallophosphoesterase [Halanaerobiales bacterium]|nr:metallophosphoesterase [Halanaerobiales bacterium]